MPSKKPQVSLRLENEEYEQLRDWAESEFRTPSALAAVIIKKTLNDRANPHGLPPNELIDQTKKFIALLMGEHKRNGISFVLLGQALDIEPEKLHELYLLVQECRKQKERATND